MALPSSQLDAAKNPQTRCSNCQTVFEVSRDLLSSSDTRVRCGECLSIFDALEELHTAREMPGQVDGAGSAAQRTAQASNLTHSGDASLAGLNNETSALDVTYSDFDLFSEEADLPEIAYFDQTRDTPDFDFDSVEMANDETFSDTLFVHDVTIDADATTVRANPALSAAKQKSSYAEIDFVADTQPREPLIFNYRDAGDAGDAQKPVEPKPAAEPAAVPTTETVAKPTPTPIPIPTSIPSAQVQSRPVVGIDSQADDLATTKGTSPWFFRLAMFALLGVLLTSLFAYRTKPQLYNNPTMRPILEAGCKLVKCVLPARIDLPSLKMVKRNVYSHPNTPNALVISVSFRNDAEFAQQLPLLHMVLSNRVGRTVAKQDFAPPDYLPNWEAGKSIESGQQLDVTLEVTDPGKDAQSFEFYFREFKS